MSDSPVTLYYAPQSRAVAVRWLLEEIGIPYRLHVLDLKKGEHKQPAYLAINPMGKVPTLVHDGVVITETAAICCYLADAFPAAGLAPAIGDARRGPYLSWLFYGPGCLEAAMLDRAFPRAAEALRSAVGYSDFDTTLGLVADAVAQGPYLQGDQFTAADAVISLFIGWGMMMNVIPQRPELAAYMQRLNGRPARQRVAALDAEITQPAG